MHETGTQEEAQKAAGPFDRLDLRRMGIYATIVLGFGLLLWAKLLLVTDHPRSAIADDKTPAVDEDAPKNNGN